jgi:hypothetical protein
MIAIRPDQLHRCQPVSLFYFCSWQQQGTLWLQEISARSQRCTHLKAMRRQPASRNALFRPENGTAPPEQRRCSCW